MNDTHFEDGTEKRTKVVGFRLTESEHWMISKEAERRGISMTAYMVYCAIRMIGK